LVADRPAAKKNRYAQREIAMDNTLDEKIEILIEASRHLSDDDATVFMLAAAMLDREAIRSSGEGHPTSRNKVFVASVALFAEIHLKQVAEGRGCPRSN
jgi:hypothetical protein